MNRSAGLTLIELLVSFALFSAILLILYSSLNYASRVTVKSSDIIQSTEDIAQLQSFLRKLLADSYPQKNAFQGNSTSLQFIGPISQASQGSNLYRIRLGSEGPHNQRHMVIRWSIIDDENISLDALEKLNDLDDYETTKKGGMVLLENLSSVEFSYLSHNDFPAASIWLSQWHHEQQPTVIRIAIKVQGTSEQQIPDLVIALNRTHSADCNYDPVSRNCRNG